ncbi:hypothetical protein LINPERPRIM_LOCUS116 [Linum perenne]
MLCQTFVD